MPKHGLHAIEGQPPILSVIEILQQLIRRKLETVVLENELIARVYRSGKGRR